MTQNFQCFKMAEINSIEQLQNQLSKLEARKSKLELVASKLSSKIERIDFEIKMGDENREDLESEKTELINEKEEIENVSLSEIERKSEEIREKIMKMSTLSMRGKATTILKKKIKNFFFVLTITGEQEDLIQNGQMLNESTQSMETFDDKANLNRHHKSELVSTKISDREKRKVKSEPLTGASKISRSHSIKNSADNLKQLPSEILKTCDSYGECSMCHAAIKLKMLHKKSQTSSSEDFYRYSSKSPLAYDSDLAKRKTSKKMMREILKKHSQSSPSTPKKASEIPITASPSVNLCEECSTLFQVGEILSPHLPLCIAVNFCKECNSSRKSKEFAKRSGLDVPLSRTSCASHETCNKCVMEMKERLMLRNSDALHKNCRKETVCIPCKI